MAVFSSPRPRPHPHPRKGDQSAEFGLDKGHALSILAPGSSVVGDLVSDGVIKVEGRVEGRVAGNQVLVARGGRVMGDIEAAVAMVAGEVRGNIEARERVELQAGCAVHGDVTAPRLVIHEGGELNGQLRMERKAAVSAPSSAAA